MGWLLELHFQLGYAFLGLTYFFAYNMVHMNTTDHIQGYGKELIRIAADKHKLCQVYINLCIFKSTIIKIYTCKI